MAADHLKVAVKIEGGAELIADMRALGINVTATTRKAAREGAKVIQADAEGRAKTISSRGGKNTKITTSTRGPGEAEARVSPSKRKWYLRFSETGTAPHAIYGKPWLVFFSHGKLISTRTIHHPGMAARPWLRPAFDTKQDAATTAFGETMGRVIDQKRAERDGGDEAE